MRLMMVVELIWRLGDDDDVDDNNVSPFDGRNSLSELRVVLINHH